MSISLEKLKINTLPSCFSDTEIANLVSGSENRRQALLKRALANGELIHVKRGLYCLSEKHRKEALNLFEVANKIYGPSYISFESALAYHGWIPEAVRTITSACRRRSRLFKTPIGLFSYLSVPAMVFFADVERLVSGSEVFFIASPWRAVADYVYVYKKDWKGIAPLVKSLRIEEDELSKIKRDELENLATNFKNRRVSRLIRGVIKDLKL